MAYFSFPFFHGRSIEPGNQIVLCTPFLPFTTSVVKIISMSVLTKLKALNSCLINKCYRRGRVLRYRWPIKNVPRVRCLWRRFFSFFYPWFSLAETGWGFQVVYREDDLDRFPDMGKIHDSLVRGLGRITAFDGYRHPPVFYATRWKISLSRVN